MRARKPGCASWRPSLPLLLARPRRADLGRRPKCLSVRARPLLVAARGFVRQPRSEWPSVAARILAVVLMAIHTALGMAADPPSYQVAFPKTGNRALDAALRASSQLEALREKG